MKTAKKKQTSFPGITNAAAALGLPPGLFSYAKRNGSPGFRANGSLDWGQILPWIKQDLIVEFGALPEQPLDWVLRGTLDVPYAIGALRFYYGSDTKAKRWLTELHEIVQLLRTHGKSEILEDLTDDIIGVDWNESPAHQLGWHREDWNG